MHTVKTNEAVSSRKAFVSIVQMTWFFTSRATPTDAGPLLTALRRVLPEGLPTRFGSGDPPRHKVAGGDLTAFDAEWRRLAAEDAGQGLNWRGSSGVPSASMWYPDLRPDDRYEGSPISRLQMSTVETFVRSDVERIARLFVNIAAIGAFYACAFVLQRWLLDRGTLYFSGHESDDSPLPQGKRWIGIPPGSPWLAWLGREYSALLGDIVGPYAERHGHGLLIRTSHDPQASTLGPLINWPEEVLARRRDPRFPGVPPSEPATVIPSLE